MIATDKEANASSYNYQKRETNMVPQSKRRPMQKRFYVLFDPSVYGFFEGVLSEGLAGGLLKDLADECERLGYDMNAFSAYVTRFFPYDVPLNKDIYYRLEEGDPKRLKRIYSDYLSKAKEPIEALDTAQASLFYWLDDKARGARESFPDKLRALAEGLGNKAVTQEALQEAFRESNPLWLEGEGDFDTRKFIDKLKELEDKDEQLRERLNFKGAYV